MDLTLQQRDHLAIAGTYQRANLNLASGKSVWATSEEGPVYLDFSSGIGVNCLGFCHPDWIEAVSEQLRTLNHTSNLYYTKPAVQLAEQLCQRTNMNRVFFANSGAEANEAAIKTARKYSASRYSAKRYEIITLTNSFHGRTLATLAATGQEAMHQQFGPFPPGFIHTPPNDLERLHQSITPNTCAILIECIQGEGGVRPLEPWFVDEIKQICETKDLLLIVDEVQTGVGRTGTFLCSEQYQLSPDLVTLAKGLGGGLPIGALLFGEKTKDTLTVGDHGSTFGGNPIVCAGACAVLAQIDDAFLQSVKQKGKHLRTRLRSMDMVAEVTGKGLLCGVTLKSSRPASQVVAACLERGLILLTAKERVRFLPPLTITMEELDRGLDLFEAVLCDTNLPTKS